MYIRLYTMFTIAFKGFDLEWANLHVDGSFARRTIDGEQGLRPDLQLKRRGKALLYLEVKPPGPSYREATYLADKWKLFNLAKDEIDRCLRQHFLLPFVVVQVFGMQSFMSNCVFLFALFEDVT